jgi:hypothetical protein
MPYKDDLVGLDRGLDLDHLLEKIGLLLVATRGINNDDLVPLGPEPKY